MSGGGNNVTISMPGPGWGPGWQMLWPPSFSSFQLDIVGFLAILGEGSVTANAQISALSSLSLLPRLMPAPQALLLPTRPATLEPTTKATVSGVFNGNGKDHVYHVAGILLSKCQGEYADYKRAFCQSECGWSDAYVTLLGFTLSVILFTISIVFGDGMSLVATLSLSLLSTLTGVGNSWRLELPKRNAGFAPPGDIVIKWANGRYLVIRCDEDVARALFFAPERIDYLIPSAAIYRLISLVGTLMLLLGVIALANARLELQFAWGGAYIIINGLYWIAAAMAPRLHWDLSCHDVEEQGIVGGNANANFTEALWKAIMLTKSTDWVVNGNAAPRTDAWKEWLHQARDRAQTAEAYKSILEKPLWPGKAPDKGVSWGVREKWDAKEAWDHIIKAQAADAV
ncbi:hypothetical protein LTR35_001934 [Friedmanniomyces endolithicus]|uniref:Uncharacterized protein n=1 Tax=Friedmanniomyces endolithicus TaxID=329885 RepID=A0AAN6FWN1_9PEZI|nr:hypothetical protein LTS00_011670 [Friedmanniomyces endolithicus]KAK0291212.1 hypothetical protein LTR35_001934 [Friedmanniomyces endolithicus]KAK0325261.1 hypothetical protein LTR82_003543 [Friedmanniomyces endolithicus]KAK0996906.1 hypothetical protein LTR54_009983 [Friedmanniomyces endolithicus]